MNTPGTGKGRKGAAATDKPGTPDKAGPSDFIRVQVREDLDSGRCAGVVTRWPPEPNGYLHIGHAKSICLNFGIAEEFGGRCHLRFDDTNPATESSEFVEAQKADLHWLGYDWGEHLYFASDHYERLYQYALQLIEGGRAFVCDLSSEEILARRGTLTEAGEPSPFRGRDPEENLELFRRMRAGEFAPGSRTLRAKIDMGSSVLTMRDPPLYRIVGEKHHRTGDAWPIYPLYDFAHCLSDAIEGITHSLCTMEFIDHRPLYDWILEAAELPGPRPRQIEFNPLRLTHTVLSKRVLRQLVETEKVQGWDDPRMPTLSGLRRRGVPPQAVRALCEGVGVTRREEAVTEMARLEFEVRSELNRSAPRKLGVLKPLRLVIENYPEGPGETLELANNPEDAAAGVRQVPFCRELYIERDDFMEAPPKKFFRLSPGAEVRLRGAYLVRCTGVEKDEKGDIALLRCSYDPESRGGQAPDGRRVRGTLHWVSAASALPAQVRCFEPLFQEENPQAPAAGGAQQFPPLREGSLQVLREARVEPSVAELPTGARFQFERQGYFCIDPESRADALRINRIVTLRDTWGKIAARR